MITKEMIESRWKLVGGGTLVTLMALVIAFTYEMVKGLMVGVWALNCLASSATTSLR